MLFFILWYFPNLVNNLSRPFLILIINIFIRLIFINFPRDKQCIFFSRQFKQIINCWYQLLLFLWLLMFIRISIIGWKLLSNINVTWSLKQIYIIFSLRWRMNWCAIVFAEVMRVWASFYLKIVLRFVRISICSI